METSHPTVDLYFALSSTFCKLKVYAREEVFARKILAIYHVEFVTSKDKKEWQEINNEVLLNLVGGALNELFPSLLPEPAVVAKRMAAELGV